MSLSYEQWRDIIITLSLAGLFVISYVTWADNKLTSKRRWKYIAFIWLAAILGAL